MSDLRKRTPKRRWILVAAALGTFGLGIAMAEEVVVNRAKLKILAGKGSAWGDVAEAQKGDKLEVLSHEDNWIKVRFGGKEGYVTKSALEVADSGGGLGGLLGSGSGSSNMSTGAAAKGMLAEDWAKSTGKNPAGLHQLEKMRKRVTPEMWQKFMADGHVGPESK